MYIISFMIMRRNTEHTAQDVVRFNGIFIDWNYDLMLTWKNTRQNTKYQHSDAILINPIYNFNMLSQHWSGQAMNKKKTSMLTSKVYILMKWFCLEIILELPHILFSPAKSKRRAIKDRKEKTRGNKNSSYASSTTAKTSTATGCFIKLICFDGGTGSSLKDDVKKVISENNSALINTFN